MSTYRRRSELKRKRLMRRRAQIIARTFCFVLVLFSFVSIKAFCKDSIANTTMVECEAISITPEATIPAKVEESSIDEPVVIPEQEYTTFTIKFTKEEETTSTLEETSSQDVLTMLSEEELYFFAECVEIEAEGEGLEGKKAVAQVLKNRVESSNFPNTYRAVVSQYSNGTYQFSSYNSTKWGNKKITEETYGAIRLVLEGEDIIGEATYFCNLSLCNGGWFTKAENEGSLIRVKEIGGHTFFKTQD